MSSDVPASRFRPLRSVPLLLGLLHIAAACFGADRAAPERSSAAFVLALAMVVLLVLVCDADARKRSASLSHGQKTLLFLVWMVAVPVYVIQTRRGKGVLWLALWTTTLFVSMVAGGMFMIVLRTAAA